MMAIYVKSDCRPWRQTCTSSQHTCKLYCVWTSCRSLPKPYGDQALLLDHTGLQSEQHPVSDVNHASLLPQCEQSFIKWVHLVISCNRIQKQMIKFHVCVHCGGLMTHTQHLWTGWCACHQAQHCLTLISKQHNSENFVLCLISMLQSSDNSLYLKSAAREITKPMP